MLTILDSLNWRYATKQYNPVKKVTDEQLTTLLDAIQLTPTSYGLQAYRAYLVTNPEIRTKLRAAAWDQPQITEASHLIVFAVPTDLNDSHIDAFIAHVAEVRGVTVESLAGYASMIKGAISRKNPAERTEWLARQAYIALGFLLEAAALEHIDATPMEGFDPQKFNEILGLSKENYTAVVIAPVGFRAENDNLASMKKVRFSKEVLVREIK